MAQDKESKERWIENEIAEEDSEISIRLGTYKFKTKPQISKIPQNLLIHNARYSRNQGRLGGQCKSLITPERPFALTSMEYMGEIPKLLYEEIDEYNGALTERGIGGRSGNSEDLEVNMLWRDRDRDIGKDKGKDTYLEDIPFVVPPQSPFMDALREQKNTIVRGLKENVIQNERFTAANNNVKTVRKRFSSDTNPHLLRRFAQKDSYVWYAAYNEEMSTGVFYRILEECSDPSPPLETLSIHIEGYDLYFSKQHKEGESQANIRPRNYGSVFMRLYLIKRVQLSNLVEERNHLGKRELRRKDIFGHKTLIINGEGRWGQIEKLTTYECIPIYTVISAYSLNTPTAPPTTTYLRQILKCLTASFPEYSSDFFLYYLYTKEGVHKHFTIDKLTEVIKSTAQSTKSRRKVVHIGGENTLRVNTVDITPTQFNYKTGDIGNIENTGNIENIYTKNIYTNRKNKENVTPNNPGRDIIYNNYNSGESTSELYKSGISNKMGLTIDKYLSYVTPYATNRGDKRLNPLSNSTRNTGKNIYDLNNQNKIVEESESQVQNIFVVNRLKSNLIRRMEDPKYNMLDYSSQGVSTTTNNWVEDLLRSEVKEDKEEDVEDKKEFSSLSLEDEDYEYTQLNTSTLEELDPFGLPLGTPLSPFAESRSNAHGHGHRHGHGDLFHFPHIGVGEEGQIKYSLNDSLR